jgi:receptor tyrosine-protein kinase erbB-2
MKLLFAVQIARGLSYLWDVEILHHDVRSDNVVVVNHEHVKLANFGLSRFVRDSTKNVARLRERVRYMAPEKLEDERYRYNHKCEVYRYVFRYRVNADTRPYVRQWLHARASYS